MSLQSLEPFGKLYIAGVELQSKMWLLRQSLIFT